MPKPFVFYVIHHSHTDIGYTDYQEKIEAYHIRYIREALDILNAAHSSRPEWLGFKWNCECYWAVERFLAASDEKYRDDFYRYVRSGEIGLSASYLNLNDLIDEATLRETIAKNRAEAAAHGIRMRSALTCDINGYGWGFADVLYDNGITRLLSDIHTHHGMYPLGRTQTPFWWESPKGSRILAWIGEHYNLGNFWGIDAMPSPRGGAPADAEEALRQPAEKISDYLERLRAAGYAFDFAPANVSGALTDNGFPNAGIAEFCARFNAAHGGKIQLRMATIDEFFDAVEASGIRLPVYSGDWTDWWADGMGSTPGDVRHFREAQRRLNALRNLDPEGKFAGKELMEQAKNDIMMYAEHTWGHSASISRPWEPMSDDLDKRKALYAYRANESVSRALDNYTFSHGETAPSVHKDFLLTVINPHRRQTAAPARFALERLYGHGELRIVDVQTGDTVPHQISGGSRGPVITVIASAGPGETKRFRPEDGPAGGDAAKEQPDNAGLPSCIETEFFRIGLDGQRGLVSVYDKQKDAELVSPGAQYPPFTPVYEVTPAGSPDRQCAVRGAMLRNRKAPETLRSAGKVTGISVTEQGPVFTGLQIDFALEGCESCSLLLTVYRDIPRIDADIRLHKRSVWDPENLYIALPFTAGEGEEFWVEKTGAVLRPRIDQIPGTCIDFYALQSGMAFCGKRGSVIIAAPDTPLISMGGLEAHEIIYAGDPKAENTAPVFGWIMNNFWETNFKASLGGFYQFRYSLVSNSERDPRDAIETARETSGELISFCSFSEDK